MKMSRSGYTEDYDDHRDYAMWRGRIASATRGGRGQAFFRDLLDALDAMPDKKLIAEELESEGNVCAIGSLGKARGLDMTDLDPEDVERVAGVFNIADCLAREVVYMNDEGSHQHETPEARWLRMRAWVVSNIRSPAVKPANGQG
jgi:hypothetical protein